MYGRYYITFDGNLKDIRGDLKDPILCIVADHIRTVAGKSLLPDEIEKQFSTMVDFSIYVDDDVPTTLR